MPGGGRSHGQPLRRDRRRRTRCGRRNRDAARARRPASARHRGRPAGHRHLVHACAYAWRGAATAPLGAARCGRRQRHPGTRGTRFSFGDDIETVDIRPGDGISCAARPASNGARRAAAWMRPRAAGAEIRAPRSCDAAVDKRWQGTRRRRGHRGDQHALSSHRNAHRRRRWARIDGGALPWTRSFNAAAQRGRDHLRILPRGWRATATTGRIDPGPPRASCRPVTGLACVWAGTPDRAVRRLAGTEISGLLPVGRWPRRPRRGRPVDCGRTAHGRLRGFPGRQVMSDPAAGPGWALVGDAAYYKDPITAHGITDALRDAELLARAVLDAPIAGGPSSTPCRTTNTPATGSPRSYLIPLSASRATSGTSRSCARTFAR